MFLTEKNIVESSKKLLDELNKQRFSYQSASNLDLDSNDKSNIIAKLNRIDKEINSTKMFLHKFDVDASYSKIMD
jgi:hypothetical protein